MPSRLARDLARVPLELQQPLLDNLNAGTVPFHHPVLMLALIGDLAAAGKLLNNGNPGIDSIAAFIQAHFPDIAHGSMHKCRRWTEQGGLQGHEAWWREHRVAILRRMAAT